MFRRGEVLNNKIRCSFFDEVDHNILMRLVRQVVKDRRVLGLIRGWPAAGVIKEGKVRDMISGTPQGGVISPLLANIYLTPFDRGLTEAGYVHDNRVIINLLCVLALHFRLV